MQQETISQLNDLQVVRDIKALGREHRFYPRVIQQGGMLEPGRKATINEGFFKTWVYGRREEDEATIPAEGDRIISVLESAGIPIDGQLVGHELEWVESPAESIAVVPLEDDAPEIQLPEIDVAKWRRRGILALKVAAAAVLGVAIAAVVVVGVLAALAVVAVVGLVLLPIAAVGLAFLGGIDPRLVVVVTDTDTGEQVWICVLEWMDA